MKKVTKDEYLQAPRRYELRKGVEALDAPKCPYGNTYQWVGFDLEEAVYVRFTKSLFKLLVNNQKE